VDGVNDIVDMFTGSTAEQLIQFARWILNDQVGDKQIIKSFLLMRSGDEQGWMA
jgi:hypothetical protein